MPVVFRFKGFRFFFYSDEGDPREPPHIHVRNDDGKAKFWVSPVAVADSRGFDARTLNELSKIVEHHAAQIERAWQVEGAGMSTSAKTLKFDENCMWVELLDGRILGVPLAWFPRLLHATPQQRLDYEISYDGLHWDEIDEDISIAGLLAGRGDQTKHKPKAA